MAGVKSLTPACLSFMLSGSIGFRRSIRKKRVPLYSVASLSALETFAGHIESYTHGEIFRVSVTEVSDFVGSESALGQDYDGYYAVFRFRNTAPEEGESLYREFHLADPISSIFEEDPQTGKLVITATAGNQFATWYNTLTGKTYEFVKGWLWGG